MSYDLEGLRKSVDNKFDQTLEDISLEHTKLAEALKRQISLELEWQFLYGRVKNIRERIEMEMEEAYAEGIKEEMRDKYAEVSISEAREYAKINQKYRNSRRLLMDVKEIYDDVKGAMEVVTSRRYVLNNLTQATVANVDNHII